MSEFVLIMKALTANKHSAANLVDESLWPGYIDKLIKTGQFRGGSAFGNGRHYSARTVSSENDVKIVTGDPCVATGFMRFEADSMDDLLLFLDENPVVVAGGSVELHELVLS